MTKVWMLIFIFMHTIPVSSNSAYQKERIATGSSYLSHRECMEAVKEVAKDGLPSFCVETYIKMANIKKGDLVIYSAEVQDETKH